jgi:hypothetical protein
MATKKQQCFHVWHLLPGDLLFISDKERFLNEPYVQYVALVISVENYTKRAKWPGAGSYKYKKRRILCQILLDDYKSTTKIDGWEQATIKSTLSDDVMVIRSGQVIFPKTTIT